MSDEEKKAIKEVKHFKELTRYWQEEEYEEKEIAGYIETALNLIEKQTKEIEELKEKNENLLDALNNSILITKYWVSKDKIKKEIEEIRKTHAPEDDYAESQIYILQSLLEKE